LQGSNEEVLADTEEICEHDYVLNEEIGIFCRNCGSVKTEIRDITELVVSQLKNLNKNIHLNLVPYLVISVVYCNF